MLQAPSVRPPSRTGGEDGPAGAGASLLLGMPLRSRSDSPSSSTVIPAVQHGQQWRGEEGRQAYERLVVDWGRGAGQEP